MKKLWTDLHSNIHHNQMDELDKWTEHAKEVLDFWPIAYYPFQMIKTESGAGLEDLCPEEEIKKDWEIVRRKVKEENEFLKVRVAYLEKLHALVQKKEKSQTKKKPE